MQYTTLIQQNKKPYMVISIDAEKAPDNPKSFNNKNSELYKYTIPLK